MARFVHVELEECPSNMVEELNKKAPKGYRFVSLLPSKKSLYGFAAMFERVEEKGLMATIQEKESAAKRNEEKIEEQDGWVNPIHRTMNTATSPRRVGDYVLILGDRSICGETGRIIQVGFCGNPNSHRVEMADGYICVVSEKDIE